MGLPAAQSHPDWLKLVRDGRIIEAAELMYETNPAGNLRPHLPAGPLVRGDCTLETGFDAGRSARSSVGPPTRRCAEAGADRDGDTPASASPRIGAGPAGRRSPTARARRRRRDVSDRYEEIGGLLTFGILPFARQGRRAHARCLEGMGVKFILNTVSGATLRSPA
jgi:glutamate synthase (NADPH/NADH) small chain